MNAENSGGQNTYQQKIDYCLDLISSRFGQDYADSARGIISKDHQRVNPSFLEEVCYNNPTFISGEFPEITSKILDSGLAVLLHFIGNGEDQSFRQLTSDLSHTLGILLGGEVPLDMDSVQKILDIYDAHQGDSSSGAVAFMEELSLIYDTLQRGPRRWDYYETKAGRDLTPIRSVVDEGIEPTDPRMIKRIFDYVAEKHGKCKNNTQ